MANGTDPSILADAYVNELIQRKVAERRQAPEIQAAKARSNLAQLDMSNPMQGIMSGMNALAKGMTGSETRAAEQEILNQKAAQANFRNEQEAVSNQLRNEASRQDIALTGARLQDLERAKQEKAYTDQANVLKRKLVESVQGEQNAYRKEYKDTYTTAANLTPKGGSLVQDESSNWQYVDKTGNPIKDTTKAQKANLLKLADLGASTVNQEGLRSKASELADQLNNNKFVGDDVSAESIYQTLSGITAKTDTLNPTAQAKLKRNIGQIDKRHAANTAQIYKDYGITEGSVVGNMLNDDSWAQDKEYSDNYFLEAAYANRQLEDPDDTYTELLKEGGIVEQIRNSDIVKKGIADGTLTQSLVNKAIGQKVQTAPTTLGAWFADSDIADDEFIKQVLDFLPQVRNQNEARNKLKEADLLKKQAVQTASTVASITGH